MKKRDKKLRLETQTISKLSLSNVVGGGNFTYNMSCDCQSSPANCGNFTYNLSCDCPKK